MIMDPAAAGDRVVASRSPADVHLLVGGAGRAGGPYALGQN